MKKLFLIIFFSLSLGSFLFSNGAFAAISINIISPINGQIVSSPVSAKIRFNGDNLLTCSYQIDEGDLINLGNNCRADEDINISVPLTVNSDFHMLTIYAWTSDSDVAITSSVTFQVTSETTNIIDVISQDKVIGETEVTISASLEPATFDLYGTNGLASTNTKLAETNVIEPIPFYLDEIDNIEKVVPDLDGSDTGTADTDYYEESFPDDLKEAHDIDQLLIDQADDYFVDDEQDETNSFINFIATEDETPRRLRERLEDRQLQIIHNRCREVIDNIVERDHIFIRRLREETPPLSLHSFAQLIGSIESVVPELRYDRAGWLGNYFSGYVERTRAPQFICTDEANIVIGILRHLQSRGGLANYSFARVETGCHGNHTAVAVSLNNSIVGILDPWLSEPMTPPEVFEVEALFSQRSKRDQEPESSKIAAIRRLWEFRVRDSSLLREAEERSLRDAFTGSRDQATAFITNWFNAANSSWGLSTIPSWHLDFMFFTYYSPSSSNLRFAIPLDCFGLMRDRIIYHLQQANRLTEGEVNTLRGLSLRDKTPVQCDAIWQTFQPFIARYFQVMYRGNVAVQARFPVR